MISSYIFLVNKGDLPPVPTLLGSTYIMFGVSTKKFQDDAKLQRPQMCRAIDPRRDGEGKR